MPTERLIRFDGIIIGTLPNDRYRVRFANGHEIDAEGAQPESDVPVIGDQITVEISPHDTSIGRLFFRRPTPAPKE